MAISNRIKFKDNTIRDVTKMYYKHGNNIDLIKSVWTIKNGGSPILIWPQDFDTVFTVTRVDNNSYQMPASGGQIELRWSLTVYYPNTNIIAYQNNDITSSVSRSNALLITNLRNNTTEIVSISNFRYITIPDRGTNNNTLTSDGPWKFEIDGDVSFTLNNRNYSASLRSEEIATQSKNDYSLIDTTYSRLSLKYYNSGRPRTENTSSTPAPYTGIDVYPELSCREHDTYRYTSEGEYTYIYWPDSVDLRDFNWSSNKNWASINNSGTVTLSLNTDTSSDRNATITVTFGSEFTTKNIYQSAAPEPESS